MATNLVTINIDINVDFAAELRRQVSLISEACEIPVHLLLGRSVAARWSDARSRSVALLRDWLSPTQLEQFDRDGSFEVVGEATGHVYRITKADTYNVTDVTTGGKLCFVPIGGLPTGDVMLAQKIALETDESRALRVANIEVNVLPSWYGELFNGYLAHGLDGLPLARVANELVPTDVLMSPCFFDMLTRETRRRPSRGFARHVRRRKQGEKRVAR